MSSERVKEVAECPGAAHRGRIGGFARVGHSGQQAGGDRRPQNTLKIGKEDTWQQTPSW